jgi:murein DD-endopeptidase MepM/ murein hydrolase activator NlpD
MAAGTESYEAPQYGNLAGAIGEKIGGALTMAAQARRQRDGEKGRLTDEIASLNKKEDKTEEEKQQLKDLQKRQEDLQSQGFGFIAKKAMGAEFGGDMKRRTKGFFQMNPDDQDDPALDKKKRFEALLKAEPSGNKQTPPGETPQTPKTSQDGGVLGSFATGIIEKISLLEKKISDLKSVEQKDQTPKTVVSLSKNVSSFRKFFSKNNKIEEEQVKIAQQQLEQQKEAADDAKQARAESIAEGRDPSAGTSEVDNSRGNTKQGKGLLGSAFDLGKDLLFGGRRGVGGRRGGRRGGGRGLGRFLGRRGRRRGMSRGMSRGRTQYTAPVGPQPMNSATPWAAKGAGERGGQFGQGGFAPRMESSPIKFASGGIVDNPTTGQAVIPQNKLTEAVKSNQDNAKKADPFAKVLQLPTMAAGALLMSTVGNVINNMGGVSKLFRPVLQRLFTPAAAAFGLPGNLVAAFFGGPAQAAMNIGAPGKGKGNGKTGSGNATNAASSPGSIGISPGAMITNGGSVGNYTSSDGFGMREAHPITGKRTMHYGIDYNIPEGKEIALKKGGKVSEVMAPDTGSQVSGIVKIDHDDGTSSRYVHLSSVNVTNGEVVHPGTMVGKVGGVPGNPGGGGSTGAHLHWEYYKDGTVTNGAGLADSYFTVGLAANGKITPRVSAPTNTPIAQRPPAPEAAPEPAPEVRAPIVLPAPASTVTPVSPQASARPSGANLPVRNPNNNLQEHKP